LRCALAAATEGLLLDPVYSGKALAGLMALSPAELVPRAIVFLATGGTPALFASQYAGWLTDQARRQGVRFCPFRSGSPSGGLRRPGGCGSARL
jgi:hypothetical protein